MPMTTPNELKSAKFSPEVHSVLLELARKLDGTMDDAMRHMLGMTTIRVPVTDVQRQRWTHAADALGVSVDQFITLRVESALHYDTTPQALYGIYTGVYELCQAAGVRTPPLIAPFSGLGDLAVGLNNLASPPETDGP